MASSKEKVPGELSGEPAPHVRYAELSPVSIGPELDGNQRAELGSERTAELVAHLE